MSENERKLEDIISVTTLNKLAGNKESTPETVETDLNRQIKIDLLECMELIEFFVKGDPEELRDALADKRVTLGGFDMLLPFSQTRDFDIAMISLSTRFDKDMENALLTREKYLKLGVTTDISSHTVATEGVRLTRFVNKVSEDITGLDGEFYPKGKFLKSHEYKKPVYENSDDLFLSTNPEVTKKRYKGLRSILMKFIERMDKDFT